MTPRKPRRRQHGSFAFLWDRNLKRMWLVANGGIMLGLPLGYVLGVATAYGLLRMFG